MTQDEFQSIVLSELKELKEGQVNLEQRQISLEQGQVEMMKDIKAIKAIMEQTAILTEFREEVNLKFKKLNRKIGTLEIVTSQNWNDLASIKSVR